MSIVLQGSTSGSVTLQEPAVAGSTVLTLPAVTGTVLTTTSPKAGNVLQVVNSTYATEVTTTSTSYVTTGLSATITPSSSSSKILIIVSNVIRAASLGDCNWTVFRGTVAGTNLASSGLFVYGTATAGSTTVVTGISINYLDSPATTSATTYTLGFKSSGVSVNSQHASTTATMTLMEIAG